MKKEFFSNNKKNIILFFSIFVFLLLFINLSVFGPWWRIWPKSVSARIAMDRLALSVYENPYCRDVCYFEQLSYEEEILDSLDKEKVYNNLSKAIFNEEDNIDWRLRAVDLIAKKDNFKFSNEFIKSSQEYIDLKDINNEVRESLILNFSDYLNISSYVKEMSQKIESSTISTKEGESFFRVLSSVDSDFDLNFLKDLEGFKLNKDFISFIIRNENTFYSDVSDYFNFLESQFFKNIKDPEIKNIIIFEISEYLDSENGEIAFNFLEGLYLDEEVDIFSKYVIADISSGSLELPEIGESDWDRYYNSF
jgi:hypothetical protein